LALIQYALPQLGQRAKRLESRFTAMPATDPIRRQGAASGPAVGMALATGLLAATVVVSTWTVSPALTLPAVCLAALAAAGAVAAVAWNTQARDRGRPNYWDLAGALTFLGMCAAMLSEPDQLWPLLESTSRRD
jgi:hypothetical protein